MPPKPNESLRQKLKIEFNPKIIATNSSFQPVYDLILKILRSTEFWEDLERSIDSAIAEMEFKVTSFMTSNRQIINSKPLSQTCFKIPLTIPIKPKLNKISSFKNDLECKSVYSNIDKRMNEARKKMQKDFKKTSEIGKKCGIGIQKRQSQKSKLKLLVEAKTDLHNTSLRSNLSWASDMILSEAFQTKMAQLIHQQMSQNQNQSLVQSEASQNQQVNPFQKPRKSGERKSTLEFKKVNTNKTEISNGFKEEQFADFSKILKQKTLQSERELILSGSKFAQSQLFVANPLNRYSRNTRTPSVDQINDSRPVNNMFQVPVSEEEKVQSNSLSDNPSIESCMSENHDKKIEMMKKNFVRRESLTRGAGLAFSFGKIPARSAKMHETLTYSQQISNFE